MYVYMTLPTSMFVYVFICMYMHVYAYMHVYIFKRVIYVKNECDYHSHTGTVAEVITFHRGDGCSRPETWKAFCIILNTFLRVKFRNGLPLLTSLFLVVPGTQEETKNHYIHTYTYIYCKLMYVYACILLEYLCLFMYTYE